MRVLSRRQSFEILNFGDFTRTDSEESNDDEPECSSGEGSDQGGDSADGVEVLDSNISERFHNGKLSKLDSGLGFVNEGMFLMDVDGNGERGVGKIGADCGGLVIRRKRKGDDFAGRHILIERTLSRVGKPGSMFYSDILRQGEARVAIRKTSEFIEACRSVSAPFGLAFKKIKDEVDRLKSEGLPLVNWVPAKEKNHLRVPSLADMSLAILIRNAECISSLDRVPNAMREKITNLVCDYRKMNIDFMRLLVARSPEEIIVKNSSWMTTNQFIEIFGKCDFKNLKVLRLDLYGNFMFDSTLRDVFAGSSAKFDALAVLSLKGAVGLSDDGLGYFTQLAPSLESINLSQCSLITANGIHILAKSYPSTLKELYIDECPMIDAMLMLTALTEFESLEVLSVAGIKAVTHKFVCSIAEALSSNWKELCFADCRNLTDSAIEVLGMMCPNIVSLDLSNLDKLTDFSLQYIAYGCRSIHHLKFRRNQFSDAALGAFLEVTGHSLTELSLSCFWTVGPCTALSIARFATNLVTLDLFWCRNLSNEMLGLIVDSCKSLKLLKIFGCFQITEVFLKGHSNEAVRIVGPKNMPMQDTDVLSKLIEDPQFYANTNNQAINAMPA